MTHHHIKNLQQIKEEAAIGLVKLYGENHGWKILDGGTIIQEQKLIQWKPGSQSNIGFHR